MKICDLANNSHLQILSCPVKRAQYDASLRERSQAQKGAWNVEVKRSPDHVSKDSEVVEWLRWYRKMTMNMIHEREIGAEGGFYDAFRVNLQEAMQRAYFGPQIEDDIWALPDCFEAEERTEASDMELLHLVSGQKLIGLVLQVEPKGLLEESTLKLDSLAHSQLSQNPVSSLGKRFHSLHSNELHGIHGLRENQMGVQRNHDQSTFVELELYLHGNLVARATRAESKLTGNPRVSGAKFLDEITVYLCVDRHTKQHSENVSGKFNEVLLGSIRGLNMTESGDKGIVYSPSGVQTHIIWQFRTPYVKHVHWFKVDGKRMLCECKSTRARLPSSKYWLFEPRCDKHDVGGWYFETLWRRGQVGLRETETTTYWAGKELGLLHPAMYIFGTAYKTLDMEAIKRRERPVWSVIWNRHIRLTGMILKAIQWCQTKVLALKH
ncbi:hypothetical protein KP509_39G038200 [Ceratopteris richardii]|uniref:Uncharacterized protein n=1 Tax=Ceratopteris richardii TaxID=49495 RepID=A0A8T2Q0I1_CERRI|nr:hypothetical protein KP509_39G038200 [Ceratopteris richardii]KAH7277190.1 hypothetical protein KP509_39G038200 [Ceratopteris richardii]